MCKQMCDACVYNGICVTELDLCVLTEAREALPGGHNVAALGNN